MPCRHGFQFGKRHFHSSLRTEFSTEVVKKCLTNLLIFNTSGLVTSLHKLGFKITKLNFFEPFPPPRPSCYNCRAHSTPFGLVAYPRRVDPSWISYIANPSSRIFAWDANANSAVITI